MPNEGSMPTPVSPGSRSRSSIRTSFAPNSPSLVHSCPPTRTYCRSSSQIRQLDGRRSDGTCCTPHVTQMKASTSPPDLAVAKTGHFVVVHQAGGLHERVADGRSHEAEPPLLESLVHRIRLGGLRGDLPQGRPPVPNGLSPDEAPHVVVEAAVLLLHRKHFPGIGHRGLDLRPVPDDARILEEPFHLPCVEPGHLRGVESVERAPIPVALLE